jgi:hypothetical protein
MISKALRNVVSLAIVPRFAATATAQAPIAPAERFDHWGVYDETRKEFLINGGFTWDHGTKRVSDVWGWGGTNWQLIGDKPSARSWRHSPLIQSNNER